MKPAEAQSAWRTEAFALSNLVDVCLNKSRGEENHQNSRMQHEFVGKNREIKAVTSYRSVRETFVFLSGKN